MSLYKITDKNGKTQTGWGNETQWGENVTHKAKVRGNALCSEQVIHAYKDPYMAVFHNPIGGGYNEKTMLLWEARGQVVADNGMKVGCKTLTTLKQIPVPKITIEQRVEIAIRCTVKVYKEPDFIKWANEWLDGTDKSEAAAGATWATARATEATDATEAAWAAEAAADAAEAAGAATEAAWATEAAAEAAWAAAEAAGVAGEVNIIAIIHEVVGG